MPSRLGGHGEGICSAEAASADLAPSSGLCWQGQPGAPAHGALGRGGGVGVVARGLRQPLCPATRHAGAHFSPQPPSGHRAAPQGPWDARCPPQGPRTHRPRAQIGRAHV